MPTTAAAPVLPVVFFLLPLDGGQPLQLTATGILPTWSPDGRHIAYTAFNEGNVDIFVVETTARERYLDRRGFEISASQWLQMPRVLRGPMVYGADPVQLTATAGTHTQPAWSPDGQQIAFVTNRDGIEQIFVMDADGTNLQPATDTVGNSTSPSWAPINNSGTATQTTTWGGLKADFEPPKID